MSGQVDTKALRALVDERQSLLLTMLNDGPILSADDLGSMSVRIDAINQELDAAAPALLDEVDALRAEVREQSAIMADWRSDRDDEVTYGPAERDALRARVAELQEPRCCSVCAGNGDPTSGRECVCGGIGTEAAEILGLRATAIEMAARVAELEREVERLRGFLVPLFTSGYRKGHHDTVEGGYTDVYQCDSATYFADDVADWIASETAALEPRAEVKP